jgi:hypothetical protein
MFFLVLFREAGHVEGSKRDTLECSRANLGDEFVGLLRLLLRVFWLVFK